MSFTAPHISNQSANEIIYDRNRAARELLYFPRSPAKPAALEETKTKSFTVI